MIFVNIRKGIFWGDGYNSVELATVKCCRRRAVGISASTTGEIRQELRSENDPQVETCKSTRTRADCHNISEL